MPSLLCRHGVGARELRTNDVGRRRPALHGSTNLRLHTIVVVVGASVVVGAAISANILRAEATSPHAHGGAPVGLGHVYPTSFGVMSVDQASRLEGSGATQLARLGGGRAFAIQVAVTLTNLRPRGLRLDRRAVRLRTSSGALIDALLASVWPGRVAPFAAKKVLYRFAVPDEPVWAEYSDPRGPPIVVALGRPRDLGPVIATTAHTGH
jgi:hypothetical protein